MYYFCPVFSFFRIIFSEGIRAKSVILHLFSSLTSQGQIPKKHFLSCIMRVACFCMVLCSGIEASRDAPVHAIWGRPIWDSFTHVRVPLTLKIRKGWKLYGPAHETDTLKRAPVMAWERSSNIATFSADWPEATFWKNDEHVAHVYYEQVTVMLDMFLLNRGSGTVRIALEALACSTLCVPIKMDLSLPLSIPLENASSWMKMALFALLGGLILNGMPCVLPILGLKLRGISQSAPSQLRRVCLFTSCGILVGLWVLASFIVAMKYFWHKQMGWGMQLQNPYFCAGMASVMVASAYSLWGVFHLPAPQWASRVPGALRGIEAKSFVSGILSVFLATPCSAPLLGPAVGFALTGSSFEIFAFFTLIAVGLALPYLLGTIIPIGRFLPKPGAWMGRLEIGLGWLLFFSAAWLIGFPMRPFLSPTLQKLAWGILGLWALIPWLRYWPWIMQRSRLMLFGLFYGVPISMAACLVFLPTIGTQGEGVSMVDGNIKWIRWSPKRLEETLKAGRTVFVDVTGMGCLLCMTNKRVLWTKALQEQLSKPDVICMRADYSKASDEITLFLRKYGRGGIPFNLLIHQSYPKGIVLSEILSEEEVLKALEFIRQKALTKQKKSS
jgi:hypothetical protein